MKFIALALLATFSIASARAASIASCSSVEHHGWYVEIKDDNKKITVLLSSDGEDIEVPANISSIKKGGIVLKDAGAASWAIRQAIKGAVDVDQSGAVALKGKFKNDSILINLNTFSGQHFLVVDEYVEELKCNKAE